MTHGSTSIGRSGSEIVSPVSARVSRATAQTSPATQCGTLRCVLPSGDTIPVTSSLRNYIIPELIGHNVFDVAGAHRIMDLNIAPSFSTGQPMAKAGIDIALHDAIGKLLERAEPGSHPLAGAMIRHAVSGVHLAMLEDVPTPVMHVIAYHAVEY